MQNVPRRGQGSKLREFPVSYYIIPVHSGKEKNAFFAKKTDACQKGKVLPPQKNNERDIKIIQKQKSRNACLWKRRKKHGMADKIFRKNILERLLFGIDAL